MLTPSLSFLFCLAAPIASYALARRGAGVWRAGLLPLSLLACAALAASGEGWLSTSTFNLSSGQIIKVSPTTRLITLAALMPLLAAALAARAQKPRLVSLTYLIAPALTLSLPLLPYVAGVLPLRFAALPLKIWGGVGLALAAVALIGLAALAFKALFRTQSKAR